jgi:hypothetical protein
MHGKYFIIVFFLFSLCACEKPDLNAEVPGCIKKKIIAFSTSKQTCVSGAQVLRYDFQNSQVYVFDPGNCFPDMSCDVYDQDCNIICALGGFAGIDTCNGENFEEHASNKILIWKN